MNYNLRLKQCSITYILCNHKSIHYIITYIPSNYNNNLSSTLPAIIAVYFRIHSLDYNSKLSHISCDYNGRLSHTFPAIITYIIYIKLHVLNVFPSSVTVNYHIHSEYTCSSIPSHTFRAIITVNYYIHLYFPSGHNSKMGLSHVHYIVLSH